MGDCKDVLLKAVTFCALLPEGFVPVGVLERNTLILGEWWRVEWTDDGGERWKRCQKVTFLSGTVSFLEESTVEILIRQSPVKYSSSTSVDRKT